MKEKHTFESRRDVNASSRYTRNGFDDCLHKKCWFNVIKMHSGNWYKNCNLPWSTRDYLQRSSATIWLQTTGIIVKWSEEGTETKRGCRCERISGWRYSVGRNSLLVRFVISVSKKHHKYVWRIHTVCSIALAYWESTTCSMRKTVYWDIHKREGVKYGHSPGQRLTRVNTDECSNMSNCKHFRLDSFRRALCHGPHSPLFTLNCMSMDFLPSYTHSSTSPSSQKLYILHKCEFFLVGF